MTTLNVISTVGSWILALSILVFFWNVSLTWRHGEQVTEEDPWGYCQLALEEWATSCPPPRHNFYRIPRIRSERPAFEAHSAHRDGTCVHVVSTRRSRPSRTCGNRFGA